MAGSVVVIAYEDLTPGRVIELGEAVAEREEMIDFAKRYDPQPFHLDDTAAGASIFRGLAASGWYTVGLWMRRYVDTVLADSTSMGSPGGTVSWPAPVFAGDVLRCRLEVLTARCSQTRPEMGIVEIRGTAHRAEDGGEQCVLDATFTALLGTRSG
ncbi:MAG: acyl dehydratase [Pseudonocardiaceae bacterium]|nr:acyl dehydratase [Pseudonocardiaceae bacterium]